jgi:hypothetical protein
MAPSKKPPRKSTPVKLKDLKRTSVKMSVAARVQGGLSSQTISGQGQGDPIPTESLRRQ